MAININGINLGTCNTIVINGVNAQSVNVNGTTVWNRWCDKIYTWDVASSCTDPISGCNSIIARFCFNGNGSTSNMCTAYAGGDPYDCNIESNPIATDINSLGVGDSLIDLTLCTYGLRYSRDILLPIDNGCWDRVYGSVSYIGNGEFSGVLGWVHSDDYVSKLETGLEGGVNGIRTFARISCDGTVIESYGDWVGITETEVTKRK